MLLAHRQPGGEEWGQAGTWEGKALALEAAEEPEPEPGPPTWRDIRQAWADLEQRFDRLLADAEAGRADPDLARRWTLLAVDLREASNARAAQGFAERFTTAGAAAAEAPGRHRAPDGLADVVYLPQTRPQPRIRARPRAAHGIAPAGIAALLAGHGSRHALSLKLAGLTAAASIVGAGVATVTVQTLPAQHAIQAPAQASPAASSAHAPVYAPPATATPRPMGRHHKRIAPPVPALPPPAPSPSPSPSQASPPAVPAPGVLNVQSAQVTLTQVTPGQYTGQLVLYATGGPARWQVGWLGTSSALKFSQPSGSIPAGESVTVTVTLDAAQVQAGGPWQVTLAQPGQPGQPDQVVTVSAAG